MELSKKNKYSGESDLIFKKINSFQNNQKIVENSVN